MSVARVGVLGAGTMGRGIAQLAALGGYETVLYDVAPELRRVRRRRRCAKRSTRAPSAGAGATTRPRPRRRGSRPPPSLERPRGCELIIEAAPEKLELKREIFSRLAEALGPEPVFASNTSSLRVGGDRRRGAAARSGSSACTSSTRRR